jgi:dihydrofolate synthase/folylpolyglutamate synthase
VSKLLSPFVATAFLAGLPAPRGLDAAQLQQRTTGIFQSHRSFNSVAEAYVAALESARPEQHILVCGSFLTVTAVKEQLAHG